MEKFETKLIAASKLQDAPYNPRKVMAASAFDALKVSIREHGQVEPIVVQKESEKYGPLVIVGGHQRKRAVVDIESEEGIPQPKVLCIVIDVDDATAKKLNLRLNRIGGEFDPEKLGALFQGDEFKDFDFEELGFSAREVEQALKTVTPPSFEEPKVPIFARSVTLSLDFGDVEARDAVKAWIVEQAKVTEKRTGEVVQALIRKGSKQAARDRQKKMIRAGS